MIFTGIFAGRPLSELSMTPAPTKVCFNPPINPNLKMCLKRYKHIYTKPTADFWNICHPLYTQFFHTFVV